MEEDIQGTQNTEQETPAIEKAVEPQVSVEELRTQLQNITGERDHKESEIKRLQTVLRDVQKTQGQGSDALSKRMDSLEELLADNADYLAELRGEEIQPKPKPRLSHREQLEQRRKETPKPTATQDLDPDAERFLRYAYAQGLSQTDPLFLEAVDEGKRNPKEAYEYLKGKQDTKNQALVNKQATEIASRLVEQKLKELGLTSSDISGPSAPTTSWERTEADYAEGKISTEEYSKARKQQGII